MGSWKPRFKARSRTAFDHSSAAYLLVGLHLVVLHTFLILELAFPAPLLLLPTTVPTMARKAAALACASAVLLLMFGAVCASRMPAKMVSELASEGECLAAVCLGHIAVIPACSIRICSCLTCAAAAAPATVVRGMCHGFVCYIIGQAGQAPNAGSWSQNLWCLICI